MCSTRALRPTITTNTCSATSIWARRFVRTTGSGWTQNATNSVIGRYYMVQFVYNLRHFGKRGSRNMADYDTAPKSDGGRRPMGPPPGGFRGGPGPRF